MSPQWIRFPAYPFVIAAVYVLAFWIDSGVSVVTVFRPLAVLLVATAVALSALRLLLGSWQRAGYVLATVMIGLLAQTLATGVALIVFGLAMAGVITTGLRILSRSPSHGAFTRAFNIVGIVVLVFVAFEAVSSGSIGRIPMDLGEGRQIEDRPSGGHSERPNVYLILVDAYPRDDTLERLFGYDNSSFLADLEGLGFDIAGESRSNYAYTHMTLASMLNLDYVENLAVERDMGDVRRSINESEVFRAFRDMGYDVITTVGPNEHVALRGADYRCDRGLMTDVELVLLDRTLVYDIVERFAPALKRDRIRSLMDQGFECIERIGVAERPAFVLAHVSAPHLPIVVRSDGSPAPVAEYSEDSAHYPGTHAELVQGFIGQLEYANDRLTSILTEIVRTDPEANIVLLSDHGSETRFHDGVSASADIDERFSTLFAARTPGSPSLFPDDITPVNVFRILLPELSDTELSLLANRYFMSGLYSTMLTTEIETPAPRWSP